jgi:hypothetical protein
MVAASEPAACETTDKRPSLLRTREALSGTIPSGVETPGVRRRYGTAEAVP